MRVLSTLFLLAAVPGAAMAQSSADTTRSSAEANASASATVEFRALRQEARDSQVPEQALVNVMAEGQAKGATDAQLVSAGHATLARLVATKQALISAGREHPSDADIQQGATLMAQGATSAQVAAFAAKAPADRSLTVAFSALASLTARGTSVAEAMAQVGSRLEASASDAELAALSTSTSAAGSVTGNASSLSAAGSVSSAGMVGGGGTNVSGQLTGAVTGSLAPR